MDSHMAEQHLGAQKRERGELEAKACARKPLLYF